MPQIKVFFCFQLFYSALSNTRVRIEQTNGQLKNKFHCLRGEGLHCRPDKACNVITACCVLFNISKELREPHLDARNDEDIQPEPVFPAEAADDVTGTATRQAIVNYFFNN